MKVYVVTEGFHSDYHICDIFSTEELAKKYVTLTWGEEALEKINAYAVYIEEWFIKNTI